ncbi:replication protein [Arsenophonus sp. PmNCSU2021_1]|uniref:replication protein n=1 Tax=Arsenophonus sp. PmNCSU2021_1 TaxID=3118989 RepID=UPI002FF0E852
MTNVAYADFGTVNENTEPHAAELEEGYVKLANTLLDALLMANIKLHQQKVMLAIIRKTYGFNKKVDRITNSQIAKITVSQRRAFALPKINCWHVNFFLWMEIA